MDFLNKTTDALPGESIPLDRLLGLEAIIPPGLVELVLQEEGKINSRACNLSFSVLMWLVLAMGVFTDKPIRGVYRCCRAFQLDRKTPTRSALCQGRQRLGTAAVRRLFLLVACVSRAEELPGCFYKGYRMMGIDGTRFNLPDTKANDRAFGRPKGGANSTSQGAFPQVGKLSLVEIGTHCEIAITLRPMDRSEQALAPRLFPHLTPEMLLMLDSGFYGFPLLKRVDLTGAVFLARVPQTPNFVPEEILSDGSFLTTITPARLRRGFPQNGLKARVIRYTLDDPQRTGHQKEHRLMTTLLDAEKHPAKELIVLYHQRWEHELVFDEQKTHQDPVRPSKPTHLRSQTPAGAVQELFALALAHFATRTAMRDAATREQIDPDRLSFTGSFQILKTRLPECPDDSPQAIAEWYENLLTEIAEEKIPPRRNRINPRVVRQPRSKWDSKRPEHSGLPPLTKTFAETVITPI